MQWDPQLKEDAGSWGSKFLLNHQLDDWRLEGNAGFSCTVTKVTLEDWKQFGLSTNWRLGGKEYKATA